jgi:hypothetical protein
VRLTFSNSRSPKVYSENGAVFFGHFESIPTRVGACVSLACLERSVANSVHTSACIPLTIWAIAAIGLTQTHSHLGSFGVDVDLPNIPTARSHYGVAIVTFRGKNRHMLRLR